MLIFFHCLIFIYFLKRAIREYSLIILTPPPIVSKKQVQHDYRGGGGHVFFAKYTLHLPYIFINTILFSYIIMVKSGLTPWTC
jgi:hypothetical protein